jgi:GNAT superfamily N-acetyltransferase
MKREPTIRHIEKGELESLLRLYSHLHTSDPPLPVTTDIENLWASILSNPSLHYLVCDMQDRLVSTCTIAIIPNLTRGARPYGLIENVVTDPEFRRRGIATKVLRAALQLGWDENCYKVSLMTGRKDEETLRFYKQAGFIAGDKTAFTARPTTRGTLN